MMGRVVKVEEAGSVAAAPTVVVRVYVAVEKGLHDVGHSAGLKGSG